MVPFLISPHVPLKAIVNLLQTTSCTRIVTTPALRFFITKLLAALTSSHPDSARKLQVNHAPGVREVYPFLGMESVDSPFTPFTMDINATTPEEVYMYMHSSGSTGWPKSIAHSRRALAGWCGRGYLRHWSTLSPPVCLAVPHIHLFHASGILFTLLGSLMSSACMLVYPPTVKTPDALPYVSSASSILSHAKRAGCNAVFSVPVNIHEWAQSEEDVAFLRSLRFVLYGGAPIARKIGSRLWEQGVKFVSIFGATEWGIFPDFEIVPSTVSDGWMYFRASATIPKRWIDQKDGTYELHVLISDEQTPSVLNLPNEEGYATGDLLVPHPEHPELWRPVGRLSNAISLTSGKFAPEPLESAIGAHPSVQGVLVFGQGHLFAGALIEPRLAAFGTLDAQQSDSDSGCEIVRFIADLWPVIAEANELAPSIACLFEETIVITTPDKPLPRSAKGSVMRTEALKLYAREINAMYETLEGAGGCNEFSANRVEKHRSWQRPGRVSPDDYSDSAQLEQWLLSEASALLHREDVDPAMGLFHQGFSNLHSVVFRTRLLQTLSEAIASSLSAEVIYENPSVRQLAQVLALL